MSHERTDNGRQRKLLYFEVLATQVQVVMDFKTPPRRPLEIALERKTKEVETDDVHDVSAALDFDGDCGWSAITDAPVRATQPRSVRLMRLEDSEKIASGTRMFIEDENSPLIESMMNQLLLEAATSPVESKVEKAERRLVLTTSPIKPGQKRNREPTNDDEENDEANSHPSRDQPFHDQ